MYLFINHITNKDRYLYYNCIRKENMLYKTYECKPYDDPLNIPRRTPEQESIIMAVSRVYPKWMHPRIIRTDLQKQIQVQVTDSGLRGPESVLRTERPESGGDIAKSWGDDLFPLCL